MLSNCKSEEKRRVLSYVTAPGILVGTEYFVAPVLWKRCECFKNQTVTKTGTIGFVVRTVCVLGVAKDYYDERTVTIGCVLWKIFSNVLTSLSVECG